MNRPLRIAGACLILAMAACEQAPRVLDPPTSVETASRSAPAGERIVPGVLEAIRREGSARIMIALNSPAAASAPARTPAGLETLRRAVAEAQEEVLQDVAADEIAVARRYATVPALAAVAQSEEALLRLAANPAVRRIDLDVGGTGHLAESVPLIGADQRHDLGNRGEGTVFAVLDTGVDTDHPDLVGRIAHQACFGDFNGAIDGVGFCPNGSDRQFGPGAAEDDAGHGTHVSGIVASRGTVSAPGVAPEAEIVAIKVMNNCSFAGCFFFFSEIVAALDYIIANNGTLGVQVVNMSLGTGALFPGHCDNLTAFTMAGAAAVNTLRNIGVTTFASSGNNGSGALMPAPACIANVVSVGATTKTDVVAPFSNSNATTDIFAPGVGIRSLAVGGGTVVASGTSMASPHAAGCAALLIEAGEATTPAAIEARLKTSPVQVTDPKNGLTFPRIDCSPPPVACTPRSVDRIWSNGLPSGTISLSDPWLFMADFDVEPFLPRTAPPSTVRIGPSWESGTPAQRATVTDVNSDGNRDVVVRWSIAGLVADDRLSLGTQQIAIWGRDPNTGELFCASTEIDVIP